MITDTIQAWQLEEGDYFTLGSNTVFRVAYFTDEGDHLSVVVEHEDGEIDRFNPLSFTAGENITIVTSFED